MKGWQIQLLLIACGLTVFLIGYHKERNMSVFSDTTTLYGMLKRIGFWSTIGFVFSFLFIQLVLFAQ